MQADKSEAITLGGIDWWSRRSIWFLVGQGILRNRTVSLFCRKRYPTAHCPDTFRRDLHTSCGYRCTSKNSEQGPADQPASLALLRWLRSVVVKKKFQLPIIAGLFIAAIFAIYFFGAQLGFIGGLADHMYPGIVSSKSYLRVIEEKKNLSDVYDAYYTLGKRQDPIAIEEALQDVHSEDDYLWLNAGHYLGILKRAEATPYLIKGLRHTASRSDEERVSLLQQITGKTFGNDFEDWKSWWITENPDFVIDWSSSLGFRPRINKNTERVDPNA